jgi:ubiquinone/menaquinone biosynthesis C-methylase UbiE
MDAPGRTGEDDVAARDVRRTYERIAAHFSKTRANPWPEVESFVADAPSGGVGLDVGCGNGRHAAVLQRRVDRVLALDASRGLLEAARDRLDGGSLLVGDAARLPIRDDRIDLAVYVATIHHLPDRDARVTSLRELGRVLAPGGRALVSAWSTAHDRFDADEDATTGFDTTVDWTLPDGETVPRYYHIYAPAEFRADVRASGVAVDDIFVSSGNCYAVVGART